MLVYIYTPQSDCVDSVWIVLMENDEQLAKSEWVSEEASKSVCVCEYKMAC